ncbi:unnamed protein product [Mytilus edulis]|uniref:Uncharacterized protein n=1 Tax=Mytilus edulis TaxID=6550 RepID=A0A8S3Q2Z9_MYTED|nr:unnamed protein product [Mytilus edulis]
MSTKRKHEVPDQQEPKRRHTEVPDQQKPKRKHAEEPERQWCTVREETLGNCWDSTSYEKITLDSYRWGEDGIFGLCDEQQQLCMGLTLWNGKDSVVKERFFGLTGPQGNHGEDVKELISIHRTYRAEQRGDHQDNQNMRYWTLVCLMTAIGRLWLSIPNLKMTPFCVDIQ